MNTGQMLVTICALTLLSVVLLRVNANILDNGEIFFDTKFNVVAISLATSTIEEASKKTFDESTTNGSVVTENTLTPVSDLGPDAGETYGTYDDFDDFDGYSKIESSLPSAVFNISCNVDYIIVNGGKLNPSNTQTWNKRITVTVTSPSMQDTVVMTSLFSYWFFR
jgi:hypothetical protein